MNTKKDLNKTKDKASSNPLWETFDEVIASEKFDKLKLAGFEVINFSATKNYQQKRVEMHYELIYPVEKGKWGISRDYDLVYDAGNIVDLLKKIKAMKYEMKHQTVVHPGMKKEECREEPFKSSGWYIYYTS